MLSAGLRALAHRGAFTPSSLRICSASLYYPPEEAHRVVANQTPPLENYNVYKNDPALREAMARHNAAWAEPHLEKVGAVAGSKDFLELGRLANENKPVFAGIDRFGVRQDAVEFHPAYHAVMAKGIELQVPSYAWRNRSKQGSHPARSALAYMMYQAEAGTQCPQTMTFACVPALARMTDAQRARFDWEAMAQSDQYDPRNVPPQDKKGVTIGMSMTEKQGGSDVRANTTYAEPCDPVKRGSGEAYFLHGHKWFTSAPMCDAFLTLAQTPGGLSCFIVPRWIPETREKNKGLRFLRLKSKLGDHSNASSEVEYHGAWGEMLGKEGRGIATILDMVQHTRLDCLVGSAGLMRRCVTEAAHHAAHRSAFGSKLIDTKLMRNVLADLAVETEAATTLAFRIASTFDDEVSDQDRLFGRIATAVSKYYICKRAPNVAYESMESLGGNGYIEDSIMPRLYRQSPLNAIWEGSGNVICLDVIRSIVKEPETLKAFIAEVSLASGKDERFDSFLKALMRDAKHVATNQEILRQIVGQMAVALQASLLLRFGHPAVAQAFVASRLNPTWRSDYGTLPSNTDFASILARTVPSLSL